MFLVGKFLALFVRCHQMPSALNKMVLGYSACHSFSRRLHYSGGSSVQQQQFNSKIALFFSGSCGVCGKLRNSAVRHVLPTVRVDSGKSVYPAGLGKGCDFAVVSWIGFVLNCLLLETCFLSGRKG